VKFIEARWYTHVTVKRRIDYIVLHDMEAPEKSTTAEAVANYFASTANKTSCHYCVDSDSIVQCVRENDIAYHAPPNHHSIGVEHAGYARQTRAQWLDAFGVKMLALSAGLVRDLCAKYDIPLVFLSVADLKAGKRGITTHANVSKAFGQSTHTDPGTNFPIDYYMDLLRGDDDEMELSDTVTIPSTYSSSVAGVGGKISLTTFYRRVYEWAYTAQRDAAVARSLAEKSAAAGRPLTAEEIEAAVKDALAEGVVKVEVSVAAQATEG
jgi:hypothetical protein